MNAENKAVTIIGTTAKINKIVMVVVNLLVLLPFIITNFSIPGIVASVVIEAVLCVFVFRSGAAVPASVFVPHVILADIATYIAVYYDRWKDCWHPNKIFSNLFSMKGIIAYVFIAGLLVFAFSIVFKAGRQRPWLFGLGGGLVVMSVALNRTGQLKKYKITFDTPGGHAAFLIALVIVLILFFYLAFVTATLSWKQTESRIATLLLYIGGIALFTGADDYFTQYLTRWYSAFAKADSGLFAWWKIILAAVLILVLVLALHHKDNDRFGMDAYMLVTGGAAAVLGRFCMTFSSPFCWVLVLLAAAGSIHCARNDYAGKKTLSMYAEYYLPAQFAALLLAVFLLHYGRWMNLAVTVAFGAFFYVYLTGRRTRKGRKVYWMVMLLFFAAEAAAWMWTSGCAASTLLMPLSILVVAEAAMLVLETPHPDGRSASVGMHVAICVMTALVCLLAVVRM